MILRDSHGALWYPDSNGCTYSRPQPHPATPPEKWTFSSIERVCGPVFELTEEAPTFRDDTGELWYPNSDGNYTCESAEEGYLQDWSLSNVARVFGPLTIEKEN